MTPNQGHVESVIGCWTRPEPVRFTPRGKMSKWLWSSRSPKDIFQCLHHPLTWSNGSCGGRGKRGVMVEKKDKPMAGKRCYNKFLMNFLREWENEDMTTREWSNLNSVFLFWHILKKLAHSLVGAWSFLLVHIRFTPSEWPKGFINWFLLRNHTMGKNAIFHGPTSDRGDFWA